MVTVCVEVRYFNLITFFQRFECTLEWYFGARNRQETLCYFNFERSADNEAQVQLQQVTRCWKVHDLSFLTMP